MKILQSAQQNFSYLGVDPPPAKENHPFNWRNVLTVLVLVLSTISSAMYLVRLANTFMEYTFSICAVSSMLVATIILLITLFKIRSKLTDCLGVFQKLIDERKLISILSKFKFVQLFQWCVHILGVARPESQGRYQKANRKAEKWCQILFYFVLAFTFPVGMTVNFSYSFFVYLTTEQGPDSFELTLPFWYIACF